MDEIKTVFSNGGGAIDKMVHQRQSGQAATTNFEATVNKAAGNLLGESFAYINNNYGGRKWLSILTGKIKKWKDFKWSGIDGTWQ